MTGAQRKVFEYFSLLSVTTYHYQTIASVRSQLSIVLDAVPLELIISLQHTVTKLSNHG